MSQQPSILIEIDELIKRVIGTKTILEISFEGNDFSLTEEDFDVQCHQLGLIEKDLLKLFGRMVEIHSGLSKVFTALNGDE